ncbi:MAG TPA: DUF222 domain-containing protein [Vicinamibacteria bacterium]|nr:DUF222 domain-containing protein [Vicinamibacteria bacterium]
MQNDTLASLARLSDAELVRRLKGLAAREREGTAQIVAHLAELDTRDVHLREGYASLFAYCRGALGLSEGEAFNRIEVARAARRFPVILEMLAAGQVHLTTVRLLAPHLTDGNHRDVLASAKGKRKAEVEEIVAALRPRPDVPFSVRKLPTPGARAAAPPPPHPAQDPPAGAPRAPETSVATQHAVLTAELPSRPEIALPAPPPSSRPAAVTPLSPDRYKVQLTIDGELLEKMRVAKDMLGHAIPSGNDAAVLDRAFTALLVELARKKFAATRRPPSSREARRGSREPSARVKRAVWVRDLGRCAFVGQGGHRCSERRFLEFHHVDPRALGGEATVDGVSLRCRQHNDYEGRLYFGRRRRGNGSGVRHGALPDGSRRDRVPNSFRNKSSALPTHGVPPGAGAG